MPTPPRKKNNKTPRGQRKAKSDATPTPTSTPPQDLPDPDTIIAEVPITSPKGNTYRILVTNQTDEYDPPIVAGPPPSEQKAAGKTKPAKRRPSKTENKK